MEDGKKLAHASQCDRTGEITDYYEDTKFRTFRPIGATSTTTDECNPTEGGTGDINQAAVKLAYPDYKNREWEEQVPAFYEAFKETGLYDMSLKNSNPSIKGHGRSCSWWVATVVVYAGAAKKDFPKGPGGQIDYMASHPETFEEVTEGYDKSKAKAGDIQCVGAKGSDYKSNGHSRIIVDKGDGKLRIAEAHLNTHQPGQIHNEEYNGNIKASGKATPTYRVFRLKGAVSSATGMNTGATNLSGSSAIGATAIKLAWPEGTARTIKQTPAYKQAIDEVGGFLKKSGDTCVRAGASCDRFVGVVVRYSGVDKKMGYNLDSWPLRADDSGHKSGGHMLAHPELWEEVTEGYNKDNAQDGDVHVSSGHVRLLAKAPDGKLHIVEAGYCEGNTGCCTTGRVTGEFKSLGDYRAFRAKNNPAYNQNCACQVNQQNQQQGIADGGYSSVEEANKAIMDPYKKMGSGITKYGAVDVGCTGGITSNCSAFTTYFVNRYFDAGATQRNGNQMAKELISRGWKDGGHTPAVYAVFSQNASACGFGSSNHTGIVLGINKAKDEILIGEAGCSASYNWTGTHKYSLSCMSKAPFTYAHPPGPPKGI